MSTNNKSRTTSPTIATAAAATTTPTPTTAATITTKAVATTVTRESVNDYSSASVAIAT